MARQLPNVTSFNAGEWSPLMYGRPDLAKYGNACRRMENMVATVQGPSRRRGGTRYIAYQKASDQRAWLVPFRFSAAQAYMLEFGPGYIRFFTQRAPLTAAGAAYELVSPYSSGDLTTDDGTFGLSFQQIGDVIYIAGGSRFPQKLTRLTQSTWSLTEHVTRNGPLQDINADKAARISLSGRQGLVTASSTVAIFTPSHVGMLLRVDLENINLQPWAPGKAPPAGALWRSDGKTYLATDADGVTLTGTTEPVHESGIVYDGGGLVVVNSVPVPVGIAWEFQDPGYGIGRIVGYVNSQEVVVQVQDGAPYPQDLIANPSNVWQLGAWGAATEYPRHVERFKNRLLYASDRHEWLSVPADYDDFPRDIMGEVRDDAGITRELDSTEAIAWIRAFGSVVVHGTEAAEIVAQKQTASDPLSPKNYDAEIRSSYGSRRLRPELVGTGLVMVDKSGERIRKMRINPELGEYAADDITVTGEHITSSGVIAWAFQKQPDRILWCVLEDGSLIGITIEDDQEVLAPHRHPTTGKVLDVKVLPSPDGKRDDVWLIVERQIAGGARRCIELMDQGRKLRTPLAESFFVDCGITYRGPPIQTIGGFDHLVGVTVAILNDGAVEPRQAVQPDGTITLRKPGSLVHAGLPMRALLEPMTVTPGSASGKLERNSSTTMLLLETVGGRCGPDEFHTHPIAGRSPFTPDNQPQPLFSGYREAVLEGGHDLRATLVIVQDEPLPLTVCSIHPDVEKNARP